MRRHLLVLLVSMLPLAGVSVPVEAVARIPHPSLASLSPTSRTAVPDETMQLRDELTHSQSMTPVQREDATDQFTRPTNTNDYSCLDDVHICLHWSDAAYPACHVVNHLIADEPGCWLTQVKNVAQYVATTYLQAGYRSPKPDNPVAHPDEGVPGDPAQSSYTDVYLEDLGGQGLYGFSTVDATDVNGRLTPTNLDGHGDLPAFLELDDDFSPTQFGTRSAPLQDLEVTFAHEFFHAVQFSYDFFDDRWFMEATAVWAEDELYTDINDNLQYVPYSQLHSPRLPLDDNDGNQGFLHYGDWIFIRYLTEHIPATTGAPVATPGGTTIPLPNLVLQMWQLNDSLGPDYYSTKSIVAAVQSRGVDFSRLFAQYADALQHPAISWSEGAANHYPTGHVTTRVTLRANHRAAAGAVVVNHLASATTRITPSRLASPRVKLHLTVHMARRARVSGAVVSVFYANGTVGTHTLHLTARGSGATTTSFSGRSVRYVELTLANAGHRFHCWKNTAYSCDGKPLDDGVSEGWSARVIG